MREIWQKTDVVFHDCPLVQCIGTVDTEPRTEQREGMLERGVLERGIRKKR